jgi:hypothetical protein
VVCARSSRGQQSACGPVVCLCGFPADVRLAGCATSSSAADHRSRRHSSQSATGRLPGGPLRSGRVLEVHIQRCRCGSIHAERLRDLSPNVDRGTSREVVPPGPTECERPLRLAVLAAAHWQASPYPARTSGGSYTPGDARVVGDEVLAAIRVCSSSDAGADRAPIALAARGTDIERAKVRTAPSLRCWAPAPSTLPRARPPATGSTAAATVMATRRYGTSSSPAWPTSQPPAPTSTAAATKD